MGKIYRSALGKAVDIDQLRLANEEVIAIGNMKVNARGDELGPGGEVVRTRNEVMAEYYKLNTPTVTKGQRPAVDELVVHQQSSQPDVRPGALRGSLANNVVQQNIQKNLDDPEGTN